MAQTQCVDQTDTQRQRDTGGRWLRNFTTGVHAWLCMWCVCVCVCVWLLPSVADTFCAHSYQQMPPDCSRNNQLYMPNLMSRRQIRGGIRIPGPWRTALPFGLKEQFHRGRQPGTQLVLLLRSPRYLPSRALVSSCGLSQGLQGSRGRALNTPPFISLFRTSSSMHREEFIAGDWAGKSA